MITLGPPNRTYALIKRTIDVVVAAAALIVLAPFLLVVALAVKIDCPEAPVLFRQERSGRRGRRFRLFKFRTGVA
jgi:polysaccharide biosynthesis protein PslA